MKVVIKVPDTIADIVLAFPFFETLNKELNRRWDDEEIESYQIHFLCLSDIVSVLNLLPFKAFYHEIETEDQKNVFSMHRAIKNSLIDNVDIFISLTKSFVDASVGKNLNADVRAGFAIGKNKLFINKTVPYLEGQHSSKIYQKFMSVVVDDELSKIPNVTSRNLDAHYADWSLNPYVVINLDLDDKFELASEWIQFFELFKNINFVLMSDRVDPLKHDEGMLELIKGLPLGNHYKVFNPEDKIKFSKVVAYAKAFVTYNSDLLYLAAYCGSNCFWLQDKKVAPVVKPVYILSDINEFLVENSSGLTKAFDGIYAFIDQNLAKNEEN